MGSSKQSSSSSQSQSGTIDPWAQAQPQLNSILSGISGLGYAPSAAQNAAIGNVNSAAGAIPNLTPQANALTNSLVSGGPNYQPIVNNAYNQYQGAVNPLLSGSLDPMQTPGLSDALATIRNDVSNNVNGMFAGAGRDLSGLNQQTLARGIAQGEAPVIVDQYNQNFANRLNAANGILGAGQTTANNLSGLQQTQFGNQINGITNAGNFATAAPLAGLQAANTAYGTPAQNLAQNEALTVPIAGLGRSYQGTALANSSSTSNQSPFSMITGLFGGGQNSPASGLAGAGLGLLSFL